MIQLRTLGGVSILDESGSPVTLRSKKHLALFLFMVTSGRRIFSRSRLCDLFWATPERNARHSLSQAVYDLSKRLGPIVERGQGGDLTIRRSEIECDALRFEGLVEAGDLSEAMEIYNGPFADNLDGAGTPEFEHWLDSERTRLARLGEVTLRRFVTDCEARGQWGRMCVAALKLIALTPLDENVHRTFMRALWLQGDAASALKHYEIISSNQEGSLLIGLSDETEDLARRIRAQPILDGHQLGTIDREPSFVGRQQEFQILRDAVRRIHDADISAVVVSGEAGIGKSRLVAEFSRSIQVDRLRLIQSRCYQAEEDLPYTPVADGLKALVRSQTLNPSNVKGRFRRLPYLLPDFGCRETPDESRHSIDPATWRHQLYEEAAQFLSMAAAREPIVWVVDDVQWIDRASGGLLHYLSRRLADRPFLLIVVVRKARTESKLPPLPVASPEAADSTTVDLPLLPMIEEEIREIVNHAEPEGQEHPAKELAVRLSAGNPYYALEVLEAASESTEWAQCASHWDPLNHDRLRKVLGIRISGLGIDRMRLLQAIAVLERHARPRIIAEVVGVDLADAATLGEELYSRSLVLDDTGRIAFTNDTMREYVYAEMNAMQRAALHLSAGRVLEGEADATPGALATHYFFGDDWPRSFGYAMEAARLAQDAAGHSEAAHFAGIAAKASPGAEERSVALETRADSLFAAGDLAGAAACYAEVLRGPLRMDSSQVSNTYLRLAATEIERCRWNDASCALDTCARFLEKVGSPDARLFLEAEHSTLVLKHAMRTNNVYAAKSAGRAIDRALTEALEMCKVSGKTMLAILTAKAVHTGLEGSSREALRYLSQAESHVEKTPSRQTSRYFTYRGIVRAWLADWEAAEADFNCSRMLAEQTADCVGLMTEWNNLACVALERGDWGLAEDRLARAVEVQSRLHMSNDTSLPITLNRANLQFYQGYGPQAAKTYSLAVQMCDELAATDRRNEALACLGLVALQRRDRETAERHWRSIKSSWESDSIGLGARERFKIAWFASVMLPASLESGQLLVEAQTEKERDVPSYLKLLWLNAMLAPQGDVERRRIGAMLRKRGLSWFCHFGRRWVHMAGFGA